MFIINAVLRKKQGKSANRQLHIANKFPAIIYGGKKNPVSIELDRDQIINLHNKFNLYGKICILLINSQENKVKVQAIQFHSFKLQFQHIDFLRV
ncbi:50S ribosomal protein L25 [Pantoea sp. Mhis]|uniref:50S ribosomal protein L25 n=1 Tax=Pantoea sp. Mhis TaxID=2576759 RepID=UPI00135A0547|nr:50S ribosomal protein L25 [Pantoea sp. Mhis]MXP56109.1 50S ribosomal protein L25 [Pantoea sp. Mhis]